MLNVVSRRASGWVGGGVLCVWWWGLYVGSDAHQVGRAAARTATAELRDAALPVAMRVELLDSSAEAILSGWQ